jgi:hypothetical protein
MTGLFFLTRATEETFYEICNDAKISSWALSAGSAVALRRRRLVLLFSFTHQGFEWCGVAIFPFDLCYGLMLARRRLLSGRHCFFIVTALLA